MAREHGELAFHLETARDAIDHAVLEQELAPLEALGELLPDRRLDDARAREADERAGLRDVDVAEEREARRDASGRGMEQHAEERDPRVAQPLARGDGLRHLHEREDAL